MVSGGAFKEVNCSNRQNNNESDNAPGFLDSSLSYHTTPASTNKCLRTDSTSIMEVATKHLRMQLQEIRQGRLVLSLRQGVMD